MSEGKQIGEKGLKVVCHFEGEHNSKCGWIAATKMYKPYVDPVGIPTIGLGSIAYPNGKRVTMADTPISEAYAYEIMNWELDEKEDAVKRFMSRTGVSLNQDQFDALVSMCYNCGVGILDVGSSLRAAITSGNMGKIQSAMNLYVKGTVTKWGIRRKVTLQGLVNRRKCEWMLFSTGTIVYYN